MKVMHTTNCRDSAVNGQYFEETAVGILQHFYQHFIFSIHLVTKSPCLSKEVPIHIQVDGT